MTLVGWSKIGRYLRVSPRTALRWGDEWGLSVERISPNRVRSTTTAIDNWMLALDQAWHELGVRGRVKLRADRLEIVGLALDKLREAATKKAAA